MVIAKPEWFKSKKGDIWRLDTPWQGLVYYLVVILLSIGVVIFLPNSIIKTLIYIALNLFIVIDFVSAYEKSLDEREMIHYAIAYRTAFWGTILSFLVSVPLLSIYNPNQDNVPILVVITIFVGILIFIITLTIQYKKERLNEK